MGTGASPSPPEFLQSTFGTCPVSLRMSSLPSQYTARATAVIPATITGAVRTS